MGLVFGPDVPHPANVHRLSARIGIPIVCILIAGVVGSTPPRAFADGVIATIGVGGTPYGIAVTPNGAQVYVSNSTAGSVSVIDTATRTVIRTITDNVQTTPVGIAVNPAGTTAYVGNYNSGDFPTSGIITAINTATGATTAHVIQTATGHQCRWLLNLKVSFDGEQLFLACQDDVRVQVLDLPLLTTGRLLADTANNSFPTDIAVTSDDSTLVVPVNGTGDDANSALFITVATAPVGNSFLKPITSGPFSVAISPTSGLAYLAGRTSGNVSVVDPVARTSAGPDIAVSTGNELSDIAVTPDGRAAIVSVLNLDEVRVVDLDSGEVAATLAVGDGPQSIALAPNGRTVYTANRNSNNVSVVALPALSPGRATGVTGTSGDGRVNVSWTAPISDGGSPITGYTVTSAPGGLTCTTTATDCTVTGLTNGTGYTFTVTATNAVGTGATSAPSPSVTPRAPTPAPQPNPGPQPDPESTPTPSTTPTPTPTPAPTPSPTVDVEPSWLAATQRMRSLTPAQIRRLSAAQLAAFPPEAFAVMTFAQVKAVAPRQVTTLTSNQLRAIPPRSLRAMRPATLARVGVLRIGRLTSRQIAQLRPVQRRALDAVSGGRVSGRSDPGR